MPSFSLGCKETELKSYACSGGALLSHLPSHCFKKHTVNIFLVIKYSSASLFLMAVGKLSHGSTLIYLAVPFLLGVYVPSFQPL